MRVIGLLLALLAIHTSVNGAGSAAVDVLGGGIVEVPTPPPLSCEPDMLIWQAGVYMRMDADGNIRRFSEDDAFNESVGYFVSAIFPSPSNNLFAVITDELETRQIILINVDGELEDVQVTCDHSCEPPVIWSPDERYIIYVDFVDYPEYRWLVYVLDRHDHSVDLILETQTFFTGMFGGGMWSPDGRYFAYELLEPSVQRWLSIYDSLTGSHRILLEPRRGIGDSLLGWGADGAFIIISSSREPGGIFRVRPDGSDLVHLSERYPYTFDWSPDRTQMIFYSHHRRNINRLDYTTGVVSDVTPPESVLVEFSPAATWSLDGRRIVFHRQLDDDTYDYYLFSIRADGEDEQMLIETPASFVAWIGCG